MSTTQSIQLFKSTSNQRRVRIRSLGVRECVPSTSLSQRAPCFQSQVAVADRRPMNLATRVCKSTMSREQGLERQCGGGHLIPEFDISSDIEILSSTRE